MKQISAIIQPQKLSQVREALVVVGIDGKAALAMSDLRERLDMIDWDFVKNRMEVLYLAVVKRSADFDKAIKAHDE